MTSALALIAALALGGQYNEASRLESQPASADAVGAQASTAPQVEDRQQQRVCVTEQATSSRLRNRRVCMTRAEWAARDDELRRGMNDITNNGSGRNRGQMGTVGGR